MGIFYALYVNSKYLNNKIIFQNNKKIGFYYLFLKAFRLTSSSDKKDLLLKTNIVFLLF